MSPGHDGAALHTDSQQLWLSVQNLQEVKPVNISSVEQRWARSPPRQAEELLTVDGD